MRTKFFFTSVLLVFLFFSCRQESVVEKARLAYLSNNYEKVTEILDITSPLSLTSFGESSWHTGSDARTPFETKAQIQEKERVLQSFNEGMYYGALALYKRNDEFLADYLFSWFSSFSMTQYHVDFFTAIRELSDSSIVVLPARLFSLMTFRVAVFRRDYVFACSLLFDKEFVFFSDSDTLSRILSAPILSDIGRACTYGLKNKITIAQAFSDAASFYTPKSAENFLCHFYSARLYDKVGNLYRESALREFLYAMHSTDDPALYDNALWYYLTVSAKKSYEDAYNAFFEYGASMNDSAWYEDFLDKLSNKLLAAGEWQKFYKTYIFMEPFASDESCSQYAYISGRLIEENLISFDDDVDRFFLKRAAFKSALKKEDGKLYYRLQAAHVLGIPQEQIMDELIFARVDTNVVEDLAFVKEFSSLLHEKKYDKVYPLYAKNQYRLATKSALSIAKTLENAVGPQLNYYPEALRIYARALSHPDAPITKKQLSFMYPRWYKNAVENFCIKNNFPEYYIYALIRSESFFDADVVSFADAVGLTQLLESTAKDMARKLKISEYSLEDPSLNIFLGGYYLKELYGRLDDSYLDAFFSYNGGITRVRRWKKEYPNLDTDLFLEVLPYTETREYGRKIASSAALYAWLYYNRSPSDVMEELFFDK